MERKRAFRVAGIAGGTTAVLMSVVQIKGRHLLLADRLWEGGGWVQVCLAVIYAAILTYKMADIRTRNRWRRYSWLLFSVVFFSQLLLGVFVDPVFLLSGDLHVPVPMVIIGGAVYRLEFGFMPILLLVTLFLSGPAWCSHLCYFGSFDNVAAANGKSRRVRWNAARYWVLFFIVAGVLSARWFRLPTIGLLYFAVGFGLVGVVIMMSVSPRKHVMVQCTRYCPVGALVSVAKYLSPFRYTITDACIRCGGCISQCRYGALTEENIRRRKPGISCTYCGDCQSACRRQAFRYRFLGLSVSAAADCWLVTTVVLHACFLFIARV